DLILGGGSIDLINGGAGDDTLVGEDGRDFIIGDAGNDQIWAGRSDGARIQAGLSPLPPLADVEPVLQYARLLGRETDLTQAIDVLLNKEASGVQLTPQEQASLTEMSNERAA